MMRALSSAARCPPLRSAATTTAATSATSATATSARGAVRLPPAYYSTQLSRVAATAPSPQWQQQQQQQQQRFRFTSSTHAALAGEPKGFFGRQMDKLQGKVDERQDKNADESFHKMVEQMILVDRFTMERYHSFCKEGTDAISSGWRGKAADFADLPEVRDAKRSVEIMDAMTDADRAGLNPKRGIGEIKPLQVTRISQESGHTEREVEMVVNKYFQHEAFAKFIRHRYTKKMPMPRTMNEAQRMLRTNSGRAGLGQQDMIKLMGGERAAGIKYNQRRRKR